MIDQTTGMKPGERYCVENIERAHSFTGFFQDGKYYLGPELLTAVGWLEGDRFIYDNLDAAGEPIFPGRVAGTISNLTLNLVDGTSLQLSPIAADQPITAPTHDAVFSAAQPQPLSGSPIKGPAQPSLLGGCKTPKDKAVLLLSAAVIGLLAGVVVGHFQRRDR